jgi:hypothetical protein
MILLLPGEKTIAGSLSNVEMNLSFMDDINALFMLC